MLPPFWSPRTWSLLALLGASLVGRPRAQPATFAKCDSSDPKQQWCLSKDGQLKDHWGRCLSRHDCTPQADGKGTDVFVDNCGVGMCRGSQNWKYDADSLHLAAEIHAPCPSGEAGKAAKAMDGDLCQCLDISVKRNVAQTFACKDKKQVGGPEKNYCGDGNQEWTLESDGTFSVPTPSESVCKAVLDCTKPISGPGCEKVCLVTAAPPAGKPPDTVDAAGSCIETEGGLGWQFVALILGGGTLYLCGGVAHGKRQDPSRSWREALPHQGFWSNAAGLVLDGARFSTGKPLVIGGGYQAVPVAREKRGAGGGDGGGSPPPPPPPPSAPPLQSEEERREVEGARRRNKEMKKQGKHSKDKDKDKEEGTGSSSSKGGKKEKEKKGKSSGKKEKKSKHSSGGGPAQGADGAREGEGGGGGGGGDATAAAAGAEAEAEAAAERLLLEQRDQGDLHSSQAKIKVVGING